MAVKSRNHHGANPRNFPRSVAEYVDQDYVHKLSPEEIEWLAWFNDCFYAADFRADHDEEWSPEARRERYSFKNAANRVEVFSAIPPPLRMSLEGYEEEATEQDWSNTPDYLNTPEYKAALDAFRETLPTGRRIVNPEETPKHKRAKRRLEKLVGEAIPETEYHCDPFDDGDT